MSGLDELVSGLEANRLWLEIKTLDLYVHSGQVWNGPMKSGDYFTQQNINHSMGVYDAMDEIYQESVFYNMSGILEAESQFKTVNLGKINVDYVPFHLHDESRLRTLLDSDEITRKKYLSHYLDMTYGPVLHIKPDWDLIIKTCAERAATAR